MTSWGKRIIKGSVKGILDGSHKTGGTRRSSSEGSPMIVNIPVPMPQVGSCVSCRGNARYFGQSKMSGEFVAVRCSHCLGLVCEICYKHSYYNLDTPIFKHVGRLFELHPQTVDNVVHLFILCDGCKEKIGIRENQQRRSDTHTRHANIDCDRFVEYAEKTYTQSGRMEELAQLYELFGANELAQKARGR